MHNAVQETSIAKRLLNKFSAEDRLMSMMSYHDLISAFSKKRIDKLTSEGFDKTTLVSIKQLNFCLTILGIDKDGIEKENIYTYLKKFSKKGIHPIMGKLLIDHLKADKLGLIKAVTTEKLFSYTLKCIDISPYECLQLNLSRKVNNWCTNLIIGQRSP